MGVEQGTTDFARGAPLVAPNSPCEVKGGDKTDKWVTESLMGFISANSIHDQVSKKGGYERCLAEKNAVWY
jgi:hypothetical protein